MEVKMDIIQVREYTPENMQKPVLEIMDSEGGVYQTHFFSKDHGIKAGVQTIKLAKTINVLGKQTFYAK